MSHYEERLEADLRAIRGLVVQQGQAVGHALRRATEATLALDRGQASRTALGDHPINRTARQMDRLCHAFVARHVPSAGHLRFVSSVMRINIALERIGDYAVTICREVAQMSQPPPEPMARDIETMAQHGQQTLGQAIAAFRENSVDLARGTMAFAGERGRTFHKIFLDLLQEGEKRSRSVSDLFGLLVVLYRLERVSDQAKNICEEVVFIATGKVKPAKVYAVLFVDAHNDCWSQMAEAVARKAFPDSGSYQSAGWTPAAALDPGARAFLDERGFDVRAARPTRLPAAHDELAEYHVIVGLEPGLRDHVPELPFHTVLLEWDLVEGAPPTDAATLKRFQAEVADEIRGLMETLRGEGAS